MTEQKSGWWYVRKVTIGQAIERFGNWLTLLFVLAYIGLLCVSVGVGIEDSIKVTIRAPLKYAFVGAYISWALMRMSKLKLTSRRWLSTIILQSLIGLAAVIAPSWVLFIFFVPSLYVVGHAWEELVRIGRQNHYDAVEREQENQPKSALEPA